MRRPLFCALSVLSLSYFLEFCIFSLHFLGINTEKAGFLYFSACFYLEKYRITTLKARDKKETAISAVSLKHQLLLKITS